MLRLQVAGHVRHRTEDHGGVVILDTIAGQWMALNPTAGVFWRSWEAGAGFDQGVTEVSSQHPEVPPESDTLARAPVCSRTPHPGTDHRNPARVGRRSRCGHGRAGLRCCRTGAGWHMVAAAWVFLVLASVLVNRSFRFSYALVRASRREWCHREPTLTRAERLVFAVSRAARLYPGRAACLEQSLAAVSWHRPGAGGSTGALARHVTRIGSTPGPR